MDEYEQIEQLGTVIDETLAMANDEWLPFTYRRQRLLNLAEACARLASAGGELGAFAGEKCHQLAEMLGLDVGRAAEVSAAQQEQQEPAQLLLSAAVEFSR